MSRNTKIRKNKRLFIYKRDEYRCYYCDKDLSSKNNTSLNAFISLDHITPISKGGSNKRKNLTTCCTTCNNLKGDMDAGTFLSMFLV